LLDVEHFCGLEWYFDIVGQQVIRGPIAARLSRSESVKRIVDMILVDIGPFT
jgi:hypothetical protein